MLPVVDDILNLAGLLLFLGWRSTRFDPLVRTSASSLAGTLRRAEPQRWKGWQFLAAVVGLIAIRAWFYWQISEGVDWTPKLDLVVVVPKFNSNYFPPTLLYSTLSLARVLAVFYFWLLFLVVLNRHAPDSDPVQKMLRLHVGRVARWPWPVQLVLPVVLVALFWLALSPLLKQLDVSPASSSLHLFGQGLLIGGSLYLSLKYISAPFPGPLPRLQLCLSGCQPCLGVRRCHRAHDAGAAARPAAAIRPARFRPPDRHRVGVPAARLVAQIRRR